MGTSRHIPALRASATYTRIWVRHFSRPPAIGITLAYVAGYVDVAGFVSLFGLFTAHMTGNFVMIGVKLFGSADAGVLAELLALPVFVFTIVMVKLIVQRFSNARRRPLRLLFTLQTILLLGFMIVGEAAQPIVSADAPLAVLSGMFGVAALAIQFAIGRLVLTDPAPTTLMTGNTAQIVTDIVELASGHCSDTQAAKVRLRKTLSLLASFVAGAISGCFVYHCAGFLCVLLPVVLLVALARANA